LVCWVEAGSGDGDGLQGAVELAVAASVVAVPIASAGGGGGAEPAWRAKCPSVGNRSAPAVRPMMVAAVSVPQLGSATSGEPAAATSLPGRIASGWSTLSTQVCGSFRSLAKSLLPLRC
jgi:hypothetical protein